MFSDMIRGCYNRELKQRNTLDANGMTQIDKGRFDKATLTQMNRPSSGGRTTIPVYGTQLATSRSSSRQFRRMQNTASTL